MTRSPNPRRNGVTGATLIEVVVAVAIVAVIAAVIGLAVGSSSRAGGTVQRIDRTAMVLANLADATVNFANADFNAAPRAFSQQVGGLNPGGVNPGRLSQLYNPITQTDVNNITNRNSCGGAFLASQVTLWTNGTNATNGGPFYPRPITTAGFKIADGFFADDTLSRYNPAGVVTKVPAGGVNDFSTPGTLAIVMRNVAIDDAVALATSVEGDQAGVVGAVRFTRNGTAPVTVYYHMAMHGC